MRDPFRTPYTADYYTEFAPCVEYGWLIEHLDKSYELAHLVDFCVDCSHEFVVLALILLWPVGVKRWTFRSLVFH